MPVLRTVGFVVAVAIVVAMGVGAAGDVHLDQLTWWPLPIGVVAADAWWVLLGRGWVLLLSGRLNRADFSSWCRTQALRYLPGGIWAPVSRGAIMHGSSLDRLTTVAAENVVSLCAAMALGGVALAVAGKPEWSPLVLTAASRWWPRASPRRAPASARPRAQRDAQLRRRVRRLHGRRGARPGGDLRLARPGHDRRRRLPVLGGRAGGRRRAERRGRARVGLRRAVKGPIGHADLVAGALTLRVVTIVAELAVLIIAGRPAVPRTF